MNEKTAENEQEVDELSIMRQVKARLDKLPTMNAKNRVLQYVSGQLLDEECKAKQAAYDAHEKRCQEQMLTKAVEANLRTANGHYA